MLETSYILWPRTREQAENSLILSLFLYALNADCWPENLGRQVIKFGVEILVEVNPDDEIGDLVDREVRTCNLKNFRALVIKLDIYNSSPLFLQLEELWQSCWMVRLEHVRHGRNKVAGTLAKLVPSNNFEVLRFHYPPPGVHPDF
ncbi:hypothetical protein V6N11_028088 [Hibiscus sabdariffa]|uniref:RNase H type-1 domain-containing protein n=2 Tax=Hibiscus sabdariffa TaxID=183260 RepID=A0ABR1ZK25_9ROSI